MMKNGASLCEETIKKLHETFPSFELVGIEIDFNEDLFKSENDYELVGYIDIIIKHNGKYILIDWKTCSWGWDARKKNNKWKTYQLTLYKHIYSLQNNIDIDKIETYFGLIKRTAPKDRIEIFEVKIGQKKINNSLKVLDNMIYNIDHNNFPKNKTSCEWCTYSNSEFCDGKSDREIYYG